MEEIIFGNQSEFFCFVPILKGKEEFEASEEAFLNFIQKNGYEKISKSFHYEMHWVPEEPLGINVYISIGNSDTGDDYRIVTDKIEEVKQGGTMNELTMKERLDALYKEYLTPIVDELNKEYGGEMVTLSLNMVFDYFETPDYTPIEDVKVKKRFNVVEELCKIEMPGKMEIRNNRNVVCLEFNGNNIATLLAGRRIKYSNVFSREQRNERQEKFGDLLKPEQEREFVQWIAETLGGEYDA